MTSDVTVEPPVEPPVGSVVRDCDGDLWTRHDDGLWHYGCSESRHWDYLNARYGPLTLLVPAEPVVDPDAPTDDLIERCLSGVWRQLNCQRADLVDLDGTVDGLHASVDGMAADLRDLRPRVERLERQSRHEWTHRQNMDARLVALEAFAAPAAPVDPEPPKRGVPWALRNEAAFVIDLGRKWRKGEIVNLGPPLTALQDRLIAHAKELEAAAPVDPWGPPRPMSELPDNRAKRVLIGYSNGKVVAEYGSRRVYDAMRGRVCWWPLPTVPDDLRAVQS